MLKGAAEEYRQILTRQRESWPGGVQTGWCWVSICWSFSPPLGLISSVLAAEAWERLVHLSILPSTCLEHRRPPLRPHPPLITWCLSLLMCSAWLSLVFSTFCLSLLPPFLFFSLSLFCARTISGNQPLTSPSYYPDIPGAHTSPHTHTHTNRTRSRAWCVFL